MPTYVQHTVLERIPDVFNAEAIWQAPGFALFSRRALLRDLLERSPREQRGNAPTRCFSHIALRLPQDDIDDDYHLTRGNRARELAQCLASLHQKDFGDLLGEDQVRYDVVGDEHLAPGEIGVRFGHAVYLPAAGEKALYTIAASRDGALWKPAGAIYAGQRLALLGGAGGLPLPGWPFGERGAILLVNDGADSAPVLQMRPKDAFDCRFDANLGAYAISARGADGQRLLLRINGAPRPAPLKAPAAEAQPVAASAPPAVWQARSADATAMPSAPRLSESDATFAPGALRRLTLVALALPRLALYRNTGASAMQIPFAPDLTLAAAPEAERAVTLVLQADDSLHALSPSGRTELRAPTVLDLPAGQGLRLLAAAGPLAERYTALLPLPRPITMPLLPGAAADFGRASAAAAVLRPLDRPWMLEGAASSPDRLGLSRKAFRWEAGAQGLQVARLSQSQTLFRLDERLQCLGAVGDEACHLTPGQHIVAGPYVLRYDA